MLGRVGDHGPQLVSFFHFLGEKSEPQEALALACPRSGSWREPKLKCQALVYVFLSDDNDLCLNTRTEAVFWSGFSCRELSPVLSSFKPVKNVLKNGKIPVENIRRYRETSRLCVQSPATGQVDTTPRALGSPSEPERACHSC